MTSQESRSVSVRYKIQNPTAKKIRYADVCAEGYALRDSPYPYFYISQDIWNLLGQPMELELTIVPKDLGARHWETPEEILERKNTTEDS